MSNQNRVQAGVPSGGEFASATHAEAGIALAERPILLAPGESEDYNELADGEVIETLSVHRSHVDDGSGYMVTAGKTLNFHDIITDKDLSPADGGRDAYLERHGAQIEDFIRDRYDADLENQDWEEVAVECSTSLPDGPLTETGLADAAWNGTKITALHNESDPGTFGSEFLGRLIREQVANSASVEDRLAARAAALRMTPVDVSEMVKHRYLKRELSDAGAMAIASQMHDKTRPALSRLAVRGYADKDDLYTELNLAWLQNSMSQGKSSAVATKLDMMRNWVRNGPDND
jgi:hypothetical protein